ncbi:MULTISPECIES: phosphatase PAP2 family protein [unclassified Gemella]|uniref:phosphatase PAP2 family protein n=1 Tax=unclassified Gemella TaxID=2624949 RepID=UPI001D1631EE|nr:MULTISPECIES: phosphatase PAP2 family protein [unclassified Gemella]
MRFLTKFKIFIFLIITTFVVVLPRNMFDYIVSDMFYSLFGGNGFNYFFKGVSYVLHDKILLLIMGLLGIFLFFIKEYRKSILILSTAFFGASIAIALKSLVGRVRPLADEFTGGSFPSGHSTVVVLFFMSLLYIINKKEKIRVIAAISIIIIPISRLAIGAHYPTDVLGGLLLGSIVVDLMIYYNEVLYKIFKKVSGLSEEK